MEREAPRMTEAGSQRLRSPEDWGSEAKHQRAPKCQRPLARGWGPLGRVLGGSPGPEPHQNFVGLKFEDLGAGVGYPGGIGLRFSPTVLRSHHP